MLPYTHKRTRKFGAAKKDCDKKKSVRKVLSPDLSANYALMLQLYLLQKQQAETGKELKYVKKAASKKAGHNATMFISSAAIFSRFIKAYDFLTRDSKTSMTIATN